jgi:WD40 repeat protein
VSERNPCRWFNGRDDNLLINMAGPICESCGTALLSDQLRHLCPRCLLGLGQSVADPGVPAPGEQLGDWMGRYRLVEQLGEGGMGVVYVAEQCEPIQRQVALKIIKLGLETRNVVARFEAERQALALMDHANIAKVLDAGATETGRPYFVMELVRGIPITAFCEQNRLATGARLDLFIQVCHAIQHAHQKGIIHRDIKPSNILVALQDGVPVPKVIDFGIAKATQRELTEQTLYTQFHQFFGTPAYMSPEQAELSGLDIDTRSDIYSLGVLLYELLTGSTPFDTTELLQAGLDEMRKIIQGRPPARPSTRLIQRLGRDAQSAIRSPHSAIESDLDWIAMKCLEKDRSRRYETANALALDIERHLKHEPVVARPPTIGYRLRKGFRRHKLGFCAVGAIGLTMALGMGVSTWQAVRATRAEREQRRLRFCAQANEQKAGAAQANELEQRRRAEFLLYVANMNMAQQAWDQNDGARLRRVLGESTDYPQRGFEWYYWQRQTHLELKALLGHSGPVFSVAFSPDGQKIATGSGDTTVKVWDAASGKELFTLRGHSNRVTSVAFSPDGQKIATGSRDATARVWDVASHKALFPLKGHGAEIESVAFSPDGLKIVTASLDGTARIWDAANGDELFTLTGHGNAIYSVTFSRDSQWVVAGSGDGTAKVWDVANRKELRTLSGHTFPILSVAFSPNGERILTGSGDQTAKVWEAVTGRELFTLKGHSAYVESAAFSADGLRIVTGSDDQTAKVWEAANGKELFTIKGHGAAIESVAFSPDSQWVITGGGDGTAKLWDATGGTESPTLGRHGVAGCGAALSPDGRHVATAGTEIGTVRVWDVASGKELLAFKAHRDLVRCLAFSSDGQRIATGSDDHAAEVWQAANGHELFPLDGHTVSIRSVAFSPDSQRIVTGSLDQTAKVWDAASGKELLTFKQHHVGIVSVAFSPDSQRIATGSTDGTFKVWEAANGRELFTLKGNEMWVNSVAFSPDGQRIVTGSGRQVKVWEAGSGKELLTLDSEWVASVAFSPDNQRIIAGGMNDATLLEAANGKQLLTLKPQSGLIMSVAFSRDGRRVGTGNEDGTAKVWEAATPQQVSSWQSEERAGSEHHPALPGAP